MRDRHFPRLCGSCQAPMARQEGTCWRCGGRWPAQHAPRTARQVIPGGALAHVAGALEAGIAMTVNGNAERAAIQARQDTDRWTDEGGSLRAEARYRILSGA